MNVFKLKGGRIAGQHRGGRTEINLLQGELEIVRGRVAAGGSSTSLIGFNTQVSVRVS